MKEKQLKPWLRLYGIIVTSVVVLCSLLPITTFASEDDPYLLMRQVSESGFGRIKASQDELRSDPQMLKVIVEEEFMPYVNYKYAALKLLGSHVKTADKSEVREFIAAFRSYLLTSYSQILTQYQDQELRFFPARPIKPTQRIISVPVEILFPDRTPVKIEFTWRKEKSGAWLAFDLVAEGVSLLSSKKAEWDTKIRQEGIPAVSAELERLARQPIQYQDQE